MTKPTPGRTADFVIIGGGSAGCVLANRLSKDPRNRVVLIEAGAETHRFWIDLPVGMRKLIGNPQVDWNYATTADPSVNDRAVGWHGGKVLGGSSAINGQIFIRGTRQDYDNWASDGCTGWSFADLLPYFLRSEHWEGGGTSQAHGALGPLSVSPVRSPHPLAEAFIESCRQNGARVLDDYFGGDQDGAFHACTNQRRGRRQDTAKAFLKPIRGRSNLTVLTRHTAVRIIFDGSRAIGVEVQSEAGRETICADREVVLSAGTIQSPAILMRSGVGPADHLAASGIATIHGNAEVGQNLREHPMTMLGKYVSVPTYNVQMGLPNLARQFARYILTGRGMLTSPAAHAMALMRSNPALTEPDLQIIFSPLLIEQKRNAKDQAFIAFSDRAGIRMSTYVCRPHSRGEIRLDTADPFGNPVIAPRLLEDPRDMAALVGGARLLDRLSKSRGLREYVTGDAETLPANDDALADHLRATVGIGYHPVGTCRMAPGSAGVVDPELRVKGVTGLRVVDASIMPTLVSANTLAPALMIAEKGADLLLQRS